MSAELYLTDFSPWDGYVCGDGAGHFTDEGRRLAEFLAGGLSVRRREKIRACRFDEKRLQSLTAGLLLDRVLRQHGLSECGAQMEEYSGGKPYCAAVPGLQFSLSHSGTRVLLLLADRPCGCDIQKLVPANLHVCGRFFRSEEANAVRETPEGEERDRCFAALWTRKESFIKMTGEGMKRSLNSFCVLPEKLPPDCTFHTWELPGYAVSVCLSGTTECPDIVFYPFQKLLDVVS